MWRNEREGFGGLLAGAFKEIRERTKKRVREGQMIPRVQNVLLKGPERDQPRNLSFLYTEAILVSVFSNRHETTNRLHQLAIHC